MSRGDEGDREITLPEYDFVVRCTVCGEVADFEDAARSGWEVSLDDAVDDDDARGMCPVCMEEFADE